MIVFQLRETLSILCRTGCGQKVDFEYRDFTDGFSYVLYTDLDGNPHNCSKIPPHQLNWHAESEGRTEKILKLQKIGINIKNETNHSDFQKLYWDNSEYHSMRLSFDLDDDTDGVDFKSVKLGENIEKKRKLENSKVMCNLLPIPFFSIYHDDESDNTYFLTELAEKYEENEDYENASIALSLQHEITHDQIERIVELQEKISKQSKISELNVEEDISELHNEYKNYLEKSNITFDYAQSNDFSRFNEYVSKIMDTKIEKNPDISKPEIVTVSIVREKIRTVERLLKSFIMKQFDNDVSKFRKEFTKEFEDAEDERKKDSILDSSEQNTIDFMTLGTIIHMITNRESSKHFPDWDYRYNSFLHNVKGFRNRNDHYTGKNIEEHFSDDDKIMINIFCKKLIKILNQIMNK